MNNEDMSSELPSEYYASILTTDNGYEVTWYDQESKEFEKFECLKTETPVEFSIKIYQITHLSHGEIPSIELDGETTRPFGVVGVPVEPSPLIVTITESPGEPSLSCVIRREDEIYAFAELRIGVSSIVFSNVLELMQDGKADKTTIRLLVDLEIYECSGGSWKTNKDNNHRGTRFPPVNDLIEGETRTIACHVRDFRVEERLVDRFESRSDGDVIDTSIREVGAYLDNSANQMNTKIVSQLSRLAANLGQLSVIGLLILVVLFAGLF